jgi:hypothetical protein
LALRRSLSANLAPKVQLAPRAHKASLERKVLEGHKAPKVFKVPRESRESKESKGRVVFKVHVVKLDQLVPLDSPVH